jgi:hypothetical protein
MAVAEEDVQDDESAGDDEGAELDPELVAVAPDHGRHVA